MLNRLVANWVYGGFSAGILLLLLAPILLHGVPGARGHLPLPAGVHDSSV